MSASVSESSCCLAFMTTLHHYPKTDSCIQSCTPLQGVVRGLLCSRYGIDDGSIGPNDVMLYEKWC